MGICGIALIVICFIIIFYTIYEACSESLYYDCPKHRVCCCNCVYFNYSTSDADYIIGTCDKWGGWAGAGDARHTYCSNDGCINKAYKNQWGYDTCGNKVSFPQAYKRKLFYVLILLFFATVDFLATQYLPGY